jgi:septal ring factor EnvC (AmiA/AmiB activator)
MSSQQRMSELEREIADLERRHDQLRDQVKALEMTLAHKKRGHASDAGQTEMALDRARQEYASTRGALEDAWSKRQPAGAGA